VKLIPRRPCRNLNYSKISTLPIGMHRYGNSAASLTTSHTHCCTPTGASTSLLLLCRYSESAATTQLFFFF
jgi:hypothetical protein